jgi:hypothetical protein
MSASIALGCEKIGAVENDLDWVRVRERCPLPLDLGCIAKAVEYDIDAIRRQGFGYRLADAACRPSHDCGFSDDGHVRSPGLSTIEEMVE